MRVEIQLATRFMREGRTQTALILSGVAVGVAITLFLSALIAGLQASLIEQTLGTQAHVVVRPLEERARPVAPVPPDAVVQRNIEQPPQRLRSVEQWPKVARRLAARPGVVAVSPIVAGSGLALRGQASRAVAVRGIVPGRFARVIPIERRIIAGRYGAVGTDAMIGTELAEDLGVRVGDRIRVETKGGRHQMLTVRGIFELGNREVDGRWVLVSLRMGQTLLDLVGGVSSLELRLADPWRADSVASEVHARTGLDVESWMGANAQLLSALRSQSSSSALIQLFVVLAVAMGIASVLVVSVVQKQREIGILRAMGASRRVTARVFLWQGGLLGLLGSLVGLAGGTVLAIVFQRVATSPTGEPLFPVDLAFWRYLVAAGVATGVGFVSAVLPARRAARLDPAEAIHRV